MASFSSSDNLIEETSAIAQNMLFFELSYNRANAGLAYQSKS
jgi:hypothetical protein